MGLGEMGRGREGTKEKEKSKTIEIKAFLKVNKSRFVKEKDAPVTAEVVEDETDENESDTERQDWEAWRLLDGVSAGHRGRWQMEGMILWRKRKQRYRLDFPDVWSWS